MRLKILDDFQSLFCQGRRDSRRLLVGEAAVVVCATNLFSLQCKNLSPLISAVFLLSSVVYVLVAAVAFPSAVSKRLVAGGILLPTLIVVLLVAFAAFDIVVSVGGAVFDFVFAAAVSSVSLAPVVGLVLAEVVADVAAILAVLAALIAPAVVEFSVAEAHTFVCLVVPANVVPRTIVCHLVGPLLDEHGADCIGILRVHPVVDDDDGPLGVDDHSYRCALHHIVARDAVDLR